MKREDERARKEEERWGERIEREREKKRENENETVWWTGN